MRRLQAGSIRTAASYLQGMTGRSIVLFESGSGARASAAKSLAASGGIKLLSSAEFTSAAASASLAEGSGALLENLNAAIVTAPPNVTRAAAASSAADGAIKAVIAVGPLFAAQNWYTRMKAAAAVVGPAGGELAGRISEYNRGFRDGVLSMYGPGGAVAPAVTTARAPIVWNESQATWGLQATGAYVSPLGGKGVRIAVLDTGLDLTHPDFLNRVSADRMKSFVPGVATVQDGNGHGTHVAGTACGPRQPNAPPRFGIAYEADLFIGKVLGDDGIGYDDWFVAALDWAIGNKCRIVNMSLARPAGPSYDPGFEELAKRALDAGTIIIAAAGNDAHNGYGLPAPVSHPADCPSIMAVAAVDENMNVSSFSNSGQTAGGGQIDLAGPGENVHSSWRQPPLYAVENGTSMATPHASGIAALWAQQQGLTDARVLWNTLTRYAQRLEQSSTFVGSGLVQAPGAVGGGNPNP
jgi:subtilisin family serine protease